MDLTPLVHDAAELLHKQLPQLTQLGSLILGQGKGPLQNQATSSAFVECSCEVWKVGSGLAEIKWKDQGLD